jgi:transcriptional regulator with XRE-family HTH domain
MSMELPAEEQLRRNVVELMRLYGWTQAELAAKLGQSQPWLSRRLSESDSTGTRFQLSDLDLLSHVFALSPQELLRPGYGKWDRRSGNERRGGFDRRSRVPEPPARSGGGTGSKGGKPQKGPYPRLMQDRRQGVRIHGGGTE